MSELTMVLIYFIYLVRAAMSVANIVRSSLGPQGLDKMIVDEVG
jgi:chaperonin GroEL (HSP60 family)